MERNKQMQLGASAQTMTSLQIAEATGKMHKDVLEAIRTMEPAWLKLGRRNFSLTSYTDRWNRKQPCYGIKQDGVSIYRYEV